MSTQYNVLCGNINHRGCAANTKGTAFVVYEDIFDAKNACEHLSGFNVCNRYLVVLYYQPHKVYAIQSNSLNWNLVNWNFKK